jgi:two-component system, OmpR family, phosphate regulon response regulator PhoB
MPWKVLAVDDEASIRRLVSVTLQNRGFEVDTANDGREAIDKIAISMPDIVVLDVMMPHMNGWEVRKHLRADPKTKDLPIVILSAVGEFEAQLQGMESAGDDYITKPFSPQELGDLVERMLDPSKKDKVAGAHTQKQAKLRAMVDIMHRAHDND